MVVRISFLRRSFQEAGFPQHRILQVRQPFFAYPDWLLVTERMQKTRLTAIVVVSFVDGARARWLCVLVWGLVIVPWLVGCMGTRVRHFALSG